MTRAALPDRARVVVVGGGVIGASIAFHLAEAGVPEVVLVERDQLGAGSTSRGAGGVRAQFSDALNVQMGLRSLEAFARFGERPGWEIDLKRVGYVFLLNRSEDVEAFGRNVELQRALGVQSRMIEPTEALRLCPLLRVDDVLAAAFCPSDGHATPEAVVQGYAAGARRHGARVELGCEVLDVQVRAGRIRRVVTTKGAIRTGAVVCAAGAWSRRLGEMVGVDLPVTPLRRQVLFTGPMLDLPSRLPMTIDFTTSFYFHREGPGLLVGMSDHSEQPGFSTQTTDTWIPALMEVAARRAPAVLDAGIKGGWAGLYEMSPDHNAMLGESADVARFLYATGFSGHGFLQAPAVGEIVRDLFLERTPFISVSPLSATRFQGERLRPEFNVV